MATSTVPSSRDVELAEHKLGSFLSDLDAIESTVSKVLEPMTIEQYLALDEGEREAKLASLPEPTVEELTPLLVFAVDLVGDARTLGERAANLSASVMALMHQARDRDLRHADRWAEYRAGVAEYHVEAATFYGASS